jgi:hypothetical protein
VSPTAGVLTLICCAGSGLSAGLVLLWMGKPFKRSEFNKQGGTGSLSANIAEVVISALWAGAAYLSVSFGSWGLAPAIVAVLILMLLRRPASAYAY